jgi:hypothetical protein
MKLPFSFSIKFLFRSVLPGFLLGLGLAPALEWTLARLAVPVPVDQAFLVVVVVAGWLFLVADMPIYMAFEGRRYWPRFAWRFFQGLECKRLERTERDVRRYQETDERRYLEASTELRRFPISEEGEFVARYPTRLGNLIASYEEYSRRAYGMDSAFYWPRLWLLLEKDLRDELDSHQAFADSAVYSAAALFASGLLASFYAFAETLAGRGLSVLPEDWPIAVGAGSLWALAMLALIGGFGVYRLAIHINGQYAPLFMAVIDTHRGKLSMKEVIEEVACLSGEPEVKDLPARDQYGVIWRFLSNNRVRLLGTGELVLVQELRKRAAALKTAGPPPPA